MRRILLLTAALLAFGSCAGEAATYWLSPTGANGRTPTLDGSDSTAAHALSLRWANDSLTAGNTARLSWGSYGTTGIKPKNTGKPSAGEWVRFIGDTLSPSKVIVSEVYVDSTTGAKRCVVVEGVTATSGELRTAYCSYAGYDTVAKCVFLNTLTISGRSNATVRNCTIGDGGLGDKFSMTSNRPTNLSYSLQQNSDNTCTCTPITNNGSLRPILLDSLYVADNTLNLGADGGGTAILMAQVGSTLFTRNRAAIALSTINDVHSFTMYGCKNNTLSDNYFAGTVLDKTGPHYLFNLRDNAVFNTIVRDTFVQSEASVGDFKIGLSTAGNDLDDGTLVDLPAAQTRAITDPDAPCSPAISAVLALAKTYDYGDSNNTFTDCIFRVGSVVELQSRSDNMSFTGNVVATGEKFYFAEYPQSLCDSMTFEHNTFYSDADNGFVTNQQGKLTNSRVAQNIFYSRQSPRNYGHVGWWIGASPSSFTTCNYNLYWASAASDSDYAINLGGGPTSRVGPTGTWFNAYGNDSSSVWADPQFRDTTSFLTFDPTPSSTGIAYSSDLWPDEYAGAIAPPSDATAPVVAISDPSGSRVWSTGEVMLIQWTATDNEAVTGITLQWSNGYGSTDWHDIYGGVGLSGSTTQFSWTLPTFTSRWAYVRVIASDASGNSTAAVAEFNANASESSKDTLLDTP